MPNNTSESYESAIAALYSPLHQATTPEAIRLSSARRTRTIQDMREYMRRIRLKVPPSIKIIHITGTKGKGSTACMCEAILRERGLMTGLTTSPHLQDIRERIRVNGRPISQSTFAATYWEVRRRLQTQTVAAQQNDDDGLPRLPGYFRMLTLMSLFLFSNSAPSIDVIILEVGMGGRYDATNVLDITATTGCGVTILDLDHTRILGDTLEKIAWEKGGIFQVTKGSTAISARPTDSLIEQSHETTVQSSNRTFFALDSNTDSVIKVLSNCARIEGEGSHLALVGARDPKLPTECKIGLPGAHQRQNAELALALCRYVLGETPQIVVPPDSPTSSALARVSWPGRCQEVDLSDSLLKLYLDGAHTRHSMETGVDWFGEKTGGAPKLALVFNTSHERDPIELLQLLLPLRFDTVIFCRADSEKPSAVAKKSAAELLEEAGIDPCSYLLPYTTDETTWQQTLATIWKHLEARAQIESTEVDSNMNVASALDRLKDKASQGDCEYHVFVTGSLYLVGSALDAVNWREPEAECRLQIESS
jgi:folylpolyglutamate synthase